MSECVHCQEPVLPGEPRETVHLVTPAGLRSRGVHAACAARGVLGSVAHQQRRCGCYVPGSTAGDDPALTKRQAAEAALAYARGEGGED